jgi:hypothetical protein
MQYVHWRDCRHLTCHGVMWDTEFSRQCCRGFRYTGKSHCVVGQMVPSVLNDCGAFIFKIIVLGKFNPSRQNIQKYSPYDIASHSERHKYSLQFWLPLKKTSITPVSMSKFRLLQPASQSVNIQSVVLNLNYPGQFVPQIILSIALGWPCYTAVCSCLGTMINLAWILHVCSNRWAIPPALTICYSRKATCNDMIWFNAGDTLT